MMSKELGILGTLGINAERQREKTMKEMLVFHEVRVGNTYDESCLSKMTL
jgi:hypothetical protein